MPQPPSPKPPEVLLELWKELSKNKKGAQITGMVVKNKLYKIDQSKIMVKLLNHDKVVYDGPWTTLSSYITVGVYYNSIAKIKDNYLSQVIQWNAYIKRNKEDYATYLRLKNRFESGGGTNADTN